LYGYKVEFEQSKPVVWAGLILYMLLTTTQTLYAYFVEKDIVFVGKRKTLSKRVRLTRPPDNTQNLPKLTAKFFFKIITERITLSSSTTPTQKAPSKVSALDLAPVSGCPLYTLSVQYIRSTSANKSLLARGATKANAPYAAFFDESGVFCREPFEAWVGKLVESVMEGKPN
jgi:signal peptidase complex subunit 2